MTGGKRAEGGPLEDLVDRVLQGDRRALARAISIVEDGEAGAEEVIRKIYVHTGRAYIVGVTGSPGVGKSTLVDQLIAEFRKAGNTVGVVAVDPTSPITGGAILGDRVRMQRHGQDQGVFIRSLATRGHLGGLSRASGDIIRLLDAFGRDVILVETVGSGQAEVEIMRFAHTVLVVVAPGLGDEIQALKAGIMEIGDVFVVNKADKEGADRTVAELEMLCDMGEARRGWKPRVVRTVAHRGEGIPELMKAIEEHRITLENSAAGWNRKASMCEAELREVLEEILVARVLDAAREDGGLAKAVELLVSRGSDPYSEARKLVSRYGSVIVEDCSKSRARQ